MTILLEDFREMDLVPSSGIWVATDVIGRHQFRPDI